MRAIADLERDVGSDEFRGRPHHVADTMLIRISVDALFGWAFVARMRRMNGLGPAGAMMLIENIGERAAGPLRLGQGPDAALAQFRHAAHGRCARWSMASPNAECRSRHCNAEPGRQAFERIAGEMRLGDLGEQPRIERARADAKLMPRTLAFAAAAWRDRSRAYGRSRHGRRRIAGSRATSRERSARLATCASSMP